MSLEIRPNPSPQPAPLPPDNSTPAPPSTDSADTAHTSPSAPSSTAPERSTVLHGDSSSQPPLTIVTTPAKTTASAKPPASVVYQRASASMSFGIFVDWRYLLKDTFPADSLKNIVYQRPNLLQFETFPPIDSVEYPSLSPERQRDDDRRVEDLRRRDELRRLHHPHEPIRDRDPIGD